MIVPTSLFTNPSKKSSNKGAIAGGVIGGLAALAAIGIGAWIFLRKRAMARSDQGYSDYTRVSLGAPMSEHEQKSQPSQQLRLYVRLFVVLSSFHSDCHFRTPTIHPPSLPKLTTNQADNTRQHRAMVVILVSRSCEKLNKILGLGTRAAFLSGIIYWSVVPHMLRASTHVILPVFTASPLLTGLFCIGIPTSTTVGCPPPRFGDLDWDPCIKDSANEIISLSFCPFRS